MGGEDIFSTMSLKDRTGIVTVRGMDQKMNAPPFLKVFQVWLSIYIKFYSKNRHKKTNALTEHKNSILLKQSKVSLACFPLRGPL